MPLYGLIHLILKHCKLLTQFQTKNASNIEAKKNVQGQAVIE